MPIPTLPKTQREWQIRNPGPAAEMGLVETSVPKPGPDEILIKMRAWSLNYRDLLVRSGEYTFESVGQTVRPLSDGAGEALALGASVTRFSPGDKVLLLFTPGRLRGPLASGHPSLGAGRDGIAAEYVLAHEEDVVRIPTGYTFEQAATIPCAGVTAWNALFGLAGKTLRPGDWVLTQGSGGVSLYALQLAKMAGARVVATTSSASKAAQLTALGADAVLDYRQDPDWGLAAREITGGGGFQHVLEVSGGGPTLIQSLAAVAAEGVVSVIGIMVSSDGDELKVTQVGAALAHDCVFRGVRIGSREHTEEFVRAVEAGGLLPVVDHKVFAFEHLLDAYAYLASGKHVGKVVVKI